MDIVLDKDGMYSVIDSVCDQPIFFLISQAEDFSDFSRRKRSEDVAEAESRMKNLLNNAEKSPPVVNADDDGSVSSSSPKKPFMFSDFAELPAEAAASDVTETSATETDEKKSNVEESGADENSDGKSMQEDDVESVYMMASSRSIDGVVEEYTKRKKSCSMLPKKTYGGTIGNVEPLPPEIEQQRKSSIHKV